MACGCKNGRGGAKVEHATRQAAVLAMLGRRYTKPGSPPHEVYPCPKHTGKWHIRTVRKRRARPS